MGLLLVATALGWLIYVWLASTIAENRLRARAADANLKVQNVEARSWFPGQLVLRDLVMSRAWNGGQCQASATRIDLPHDALGLIQGEFHVETMTADGVSVACGPSTERSETALTTKAWLGTEPFEVRAQDLDVTGNRVQFDHIEAALESFTWNHEGGAETQFEGRSTVEAKTVGAKELPSADARPAQVEWRVRIPTLRHNGEHGLSAEGRSVQLRISSDLEHPLPIGEPADLHLRASALAVSRDHLVVTADSATVEGRLTGGPSEATLLDNARLSLEGAKLFDDRAAADTRPAHSSDARPQERPFSATVQLNAVSATEGYAGQLHAAGGDAGLILTFVQRDLPEWIESKFQGEPFELEAALAVNDDAVRLDDVSLERGALHLRGWWLLDPDERAGALLLEYGGLSVGIDGSPGGRVVLRPGPEWLQQP